jgi:polyhydroxyalkanoate synthesis regulator phasin
VVNDRHPEEEEMSFESVRGYFQLASGLGELTRARATEAAQGMLSLPGVGVATGKLAVQVSALAEELLAAAKTNREHLTTLVRSEVEVAVTRLGLGTAEKLEESRAEVSRLRAEVASLRLALTRSTTGAAVWKSAVKKPAVKKSAAKKSAVKKAAAKKSAPARQSAVTTRRKPAETELSRDEPEAK